MQEVLLDHVFETLGVRGNSVAHPIVMTEPVAVPSYCRARTYWQLYVYIDASDMTQASSVDEIGIAAAQLLT